MEVYERERNHNRGRLLGLWSRADPNLGKNDVLIIGELFKIENEKNEMNDEKKKLCLKLASFALESVRKEQPGLSCIKVANALAHIYQNASAIEFYGQLLRHLITSLCVEQAQQIDERIEESADLHFLENSWFKHNANLKFLLDFFVPNNIQGEWLRESLQKAAISAYRQIVIIGSKLQANVTKRFEDGQMSRDEQITAIQILNAVDEQFFDVHLSSTLVKLTQLMEQASPDEMTTANLVFETVEWLELEHRMFAIISSDATQINLFLKTTREHLVKNLLVNHLKQEESFCGLVENKEFEALKQLYLLFEQVDDGSVDLIELMANFIRQKKTVRQQPLKASFNVGSPKSPNRIPHSIIAVNEILAFKSLLFNSILNDCFHADKRYRDRIELELQRLIVAQKHFPQYLAFYIDYQLKRRQNDDVCKASELLRYVENDDTFEQCYRGYLAGRLINGTPAELHTENWLIDSFKAEHGAVFVRKMEKMIVDIMTSRDLLSEYVKTFNQDPEANVNVADEPPPLINGIHFTGTVLTENFWPPHYSAVSCPLPLCFTDVFNSFEQFYMTKYSGRKLKLNVGAGSAVLSARFCGPDAYQETQNRVAVKDVSPIDLSQMRNIVKKSLIVSPAQAAVFYMLNDRSFITAQNILALNLPLKILQRAILSMVKLHVVCRQGDATPNFAADSQDIYYVNDDFRSKKPIVNLRKNMIL